MTQIKTTFELAEEIVDKFDISFRRGYWIINGKSRSYSAIIKIVREQLQPGSRKLEMEVIEEIKVICNYPLIYC